MIYILVFRSQIEDDATRSPQTVRVYGKAITTKSGSIWKRKNKKSSRSCFLLNRRTQTRNRKRINLGGKSFQSWWAFAAFFGIP
jgi:hypothetical protein